MKKKIFAALAASVMLCGVLTAPASAEAKYKKGDVNMDGEISSDDAILALTEYTYYLVSGKHHYLTVEQIELADVDGKTETARSRTSKVSLDDCICILQYYTDCIADAELKETDILVWIQSRHPKLLEKEG